MSRLLEIRNLRIAARPAGATIVDNVNLALERGEVLGLIGESGAGKSTIGLATLGYVRPGCAVLSGQVLLDGENVLAMAPNDLRTIRGRRVAYVAQSAAASFNPARRLGDQVAETLVRHRISDKRSARNRAVELFAEMDLPYPQTFGQRYPHQASGGQLQRAMAAMAMSCRPDILVLDEPTTALDVTTQIEVLASIRKLIRMHGTAALYISHDLALVAQIADRIMVLRQGALVEEGRRDDVLQRPAQAYTRNLVSVRVADTTMEFAPPKARTADALLKLEGVTAGYHAGKTTIKDISLTIDPGETLAVVGESGSGKTSLARAICGLLSPSEGTVTFAGKQLQRSMAQRDRDDLRRVQFVHQMPDVALNPRHRVDLVLGRPMSVYRNLQGPELSRRVADLLEMVDLPRGFATRLPAQLSGGEKQRVCIARALAAEPDLMICDEITSALDPIVADGIIKLLQRLQREMNLSYLFISHDLGAVRRIGDRVAVMLNGAVVDQGAMAKVLSPPQHWYTALLLSSVPQMRPGWLDETLAARNRLGSRRE